jgi:membrane-associated phospholipid phosphatase
LKDNFISRLRPIDTALLAYIITEILVILVFLSGMPRWLYVLFFYICAGIIVLLMAVFPYDESSKGGKAVRILYPLLLMLFFYRAIGPQLFIVFEDPFDQAIHQLELSVFGVDPAFALQKYVDVWVNEIMHFGYLSLYLIFPVTIIGFLLARRWKSLEKLVLASVLAVGFCFLIHIFFPVAGPRFFLDEIYYLPIVGPLFTPLARKMVDLTGFYGASLPSSHCAIAFVVLWGISRDIRKLAIPSFFAFILICATAVYGRFHYLTDAVAGVIIGVLAVAISSLWYDWFLKNKEREEPKYLE